MFNTHFSWNATLLIHTYRTTFYDHQNENYTYLVITLTLREAILTQILIVLFDTIKYIPN